MHISKPDVFGTDIAGMLSVPDKQTPPPATFEFRAVFLAYDPPRGTAPEDEPVFVDVPGELKSEDEFGTEIPDTPLHADQKTDPDPEVPTGLAAPPVNGSPVAPQPEKAADLTRDLRPGPRVPDALALIPADSPRIEAGPRSMPVTAIAPILTLGEVAPFQRPRAVPDDRGMRFSPDQGNATRGPLTSATGETGGRGRGIAHNGITGPLPETTPWKQAVAVDTPKITPGFQIDQAAPAQLKPVEAAVTTDSILFRQHQFAPVTDAVSQSGKSSPRTIAPIVGATDDNPQNGRLTHSDFPAPPRQRPEVNSDLPGGDQRRDIYWYSARMHPDAIRPDRPPTIEDPTDAPRTDSQAAASNGSPQTALWVAPTVAGPPPPASRNVQLQNIPEPATGEGKAGTQIQTDAIGGVDTKHRVDPSLSSAGSASPGPASPARPVVVQIAQSAPSPGQAAVEITLNPEELGRVRLSLAGSDGNLTLTITAERPETLDLLRRHASELGQEYKSLGYDDVDFRFQQGSSEQNPQSSDRSLAAQREERLDRPEATKPLPAVSVKTGLDIRI